MNVPPNSRKISRITTELTFRCNSQCLGCSRKKVINNKLFNLNDQVYTFTLESFKIAFPVETLEQIKTIYLSGTFGDSIVCPDFFEILSYIKDCGCYLQISTNGSFRDEEYWTKIANILTKKDRIDFCLDGLADTHSIYRVGTSYEKILNNAKAVIATKRTRVSWKFIVFNHNEHQVEEAKKISQELGFTYFRLKHNNRTHWLPHQIQYVHKLYTKTKFEKACASFISLFEKKLIECKGDKEYYISPEGLVFKCCYAELNYYLKMTKFKYPDNFEEWFNVYKRPLLEIVDDPYWQKLDKKIKSGRRVDKLCSNKCTKDCRVCTFIDIIDFRKK